MDYKLLVKLNLQFFADYDFNSIADEFDKEYQEELPPSEEETPQEEETELQESDVNTEDSDGQGEEVEVQESQVDLQNDDGRNQAFAQLRRERDELARQAAFIKRLAEENGLTVEEMQRQYDESRLQKQAEEQGVPVEVLQRLNQLERENQEVKQQYTAERFNRDVAEVVSKYEASQQDMEKTFAYIVQNGLKDLVQTGAVPFEQAYKLAHIDNLVENAKKNAVQEDLSKRKQRQQQATIPASGAQTNPVDDLDDLVDKDVKAIMDRW